MQVVKAQPEPAKYRSLMYSATSYAPSAAPSSRVRSARNHEGKHTSASHYDHDQSNFRHSESAPGAAPSDSVASKAKSEWALLGLLEAKMFNHELSQKKQYKVKQKKLQKLTLDKQMLEHELIEEANRQEALSEAQRVLRDVVVFNQEERKKYEHNKQKALRVKSERENQIAENIDARNREVQRRKEEEAAELAAIRADLEKDKEQARVKKEETRCIFYLLFLSFKNIGF